MDIIRLQLQKKNENILLLEEIVNKLNLTSYYYYLKNRNNFNSLLPVKEKTSYIFTVYIFNPTLF